MIKPIIFEFGKPKLWQDRYVSVRSDKVEEAFKAKVPLMVKWKDEFMIIPVEDLNKGRVSPEIFKSKYGKGSYRLIDYDWKPTEKPAVVLSTLF